MSLLAKFALFSIVAFVVICGTALLFSARPTPVLGVDGNSLAHSVDDAQSNCKQLPDGNWSCLVTDGLRPARYEVDVRWDGCWEATRNSGPASRRAPEKLSGCVDIWDHLQLENTFN